MGLTNNPLENNNNNIKIFFENERLSILGCLHHYKLYFINICHDQDKQYNLEYKIPKSLKDLAFKYLKFDFFLKQTKNENIVFKFEIKETNDSKVDDGIQDEDEEESLNESDEEEYDELEFAEAEDSLYATILEQFHKNITDLDTYVKFKFCTRVYSVKNDSCTCLNFMKKAYCVHSLAYKVFLGEFEIDKESNFEVKIKPGRKKKTKGLALHKFI